MKIRYIILSVITLIASLSVSAKVRYVFYFIGDGMGMGHVNTTQYYNRMVLGNDTPLLMMQFPVASQAQTYSASAPITDSAAAVQHCQRKQDTQLHHRSCSRHHNPPHLNSTQTQGRRMGRGRTIVMCRRRCDPRGILCPSGRPKHVL